MFGFKGPPRAADSKQRESKVFRKPDPRAAKPPAVSARAKNFCPRCDRAAVQHGLCPRPRCTSRVVCMPRTVCSGCAVACCDADMAAQCRRCDAGFCVECELAGRCVAVGTGGDRPLCASCARQDDREATAARRAISCFTGGGGVVWLRARSSDRVSFELDHMGRLCAVSAPFRCAEVAGWIHVSFALRLGLGQCDVLEADEENPGGAPRRVLGVLACAGDATDHASLVEFVADRAAACSVRPAEPQAAAPPWKQWSVPAALPDQCHWCAVCRGDAERIRPTLNQQKRFHDAHLAYQEDERKRHPLRQPSSCSHWCVACNGDTAVACCRREVEVLEWISSSPLPSASRSPQPFCPGAGAV